jgi:hypothetical protein
VTDHTGGAPGPFRPAPAYGSTTCDNRHPRAATTGRRQTHVMLSSKVPSPAASGHGPRRAAGRLVVGASAEEVVETARLDVGRVDPTDVGVDTVADDDVAFDVGGAGRVVVAGRAVDGVTTIGVARVVDVGRGTVSRAGPDPGRTRMYNARVTAKIALRTNVERRTRRCISSGMVRSFRDLRTSQCPLPEGRSRYGPVAPGRR